MRYASCSRALLHLALLPIVLSGAIGCAVKERTKPLPQTFLEGRDVTVVDKTLPFKHAWVDPKLPEQGYTNVWFRTVTADTLSKESWLASKGTLLTKESEYEKLADELAEYFKQELIESVANYKDGVISVVDSAQPRGLIIDIGLTELEFSHPIQKAGFMLVPIPASSLVFNTVSDPHVSFAAKVYDAQSGRLIATLADRRFPPTRLLDVNKLTLSSSAREICDTWAEIIAEGLNRKRFTDVPDRGFFAILPW
ncbi:MAG: hypothetical protein RL518_822 [Pseudomonadota bacterium]